MEEDKEIKDTFVKNKVIRKFTAANLSLKPIKGRVSLKKIDRGILCSICQDDLEQNQSVLQLDWGKTHLLHFNCFKEWVKFKFECPTCRTNLVNLYKDKLQIEAKEKKEYWEDYKYLYPEDLIPVHKAKERVLNEIANYERKNLLEGKTSLNLFQNQ